MATLPSTGGIHKYTVQESNALSLGQKGSTIIADTNAHTATGGEWVAITFLTATVLNTLTPSSTSFFGDSAGASAIDTPNTGSADTTASVTFPAGVTIYGNWSVIDLTSGSCIAYLG